MGRINKRSTNEEKCDPCISRVVTIHFRGVPMSSFPGNLRSPLIKGLLWFITGAALASAAFIFLLMNEQRAGTLVLRTYAVAPALEVPLRRALEYALGPQGRIIETGV